MTYGELFLIWLERILLIVLALAVMGMAVTAISRAKAAGRKSDEVIARADYLLAKYGR